MKQMISLMIKKNFEEVMAEEGVKITDMNRESLTERLMPVYRNLCNTVNFHVGEDRQAREAVAAILDELGAV